MLIALALAAAPVSLDTKTTLLDFSYKWSSEAAAIPALDRRFRADAARQKAAATKTAAADRRERLKSFSPNDWPGHEFKREWSTAGQSARLLSLTGSTYTFTGGAHGMGVTSTLLWDRRLNKEIGIDALLQRRGWWDGAIRQPFCVLLDREREKRREQPVKRSELFGDCPKLSELSLVLTDDDHDGRFDHVDVTADQYVAGSYAEGPYEISLPLTAAMVSRVKPDYASSFEARPPVK